MEGRLTHGPWDHPAFIMTLNLHSRYSELLIISSSSTSETEGTRLTRDYCALIPSRSKTLSRPASEGFIPSSLPVPHKRSQHLLHPPRAACSSVYPSSRGPD